MGWTYSDYDQQSTPALQIARGKLFLQELRNAVGREVDADGKRVSSAEVRQMLADTRSHLREIQADAGIAGGVSLADLSGTRGGASDDE